MRFSSCVASFIEARAAARYSEHTLSDYQNTYRKLAGHLVSDPKMVDIGASDLTRFLAGLDDLSKKTVLNYHTGLSSLWGWAVERGIVTENIVHQIQPPRPEKREIEPLTRSDMVDLLTAAEASRQPLRDRAILLSLLDTGIRASEICELRIKDLNTVTGRVLVFGKGDKERIVKMCEQTMGSVLTYLTTREISNLKRHKYEFVFTSSRSSTALNRHSLGDLLERLAERAGVPGVHAHKIRHTFAINFLRNGGNIFALQKLLGHTTLDMVKRYLTIAQKDIDQAFDKASPVKNWNL